MNRRIDWNTDMPLRSVRGPIFDKYKYKIPRHTIPQRVPAQVSSTLKNTPIPDQKMDNYDFTFGIFGPPGMLVSPGIVGKEQTAYVTTAFNKKKIQRDYPQKQQHRENSFYKGPQRNIEYFIDFPMAIPTDLPCSVSGFKY